MSWLEFDELFAGSRRRIPWRDAGFDPRLPLLDVGPGSGRGLVELAEAFPTSEIVALEPDSLARALLTQRVAMRPDLRERVTIHSTPVEDAKLPQCGGAVATGVLYFMAFEARARCWRALADVLGVGACAVIEVGDANDPVEAERPQLVDTRVLGRLTYQRWFSQRPWRDGQVELTNACRVYEDGDLTREVVDTFRSWVLPDSAKRAEAVATGRFEVRPFPTTDLYVRVTRI